MTVNQPGDMANANFNLPARTPLTENPFMSRDDTQAQPVNAATDQLDLASADYCDPVIEVYKKDIDRTLLRENLKLTVTERFEKFERFMEYVYEMQAAGRKARSKQQDHGT